MKIAVFTGAGISKESGLDTFRSETGLWEQHKIEDVATYEGYKRNPQLVLDFYNQRRRDVNNAEPNKAHVLLAQLEKNHEVSIITQNIDDLHERAGSTKVLHLHGEIFKAKGDVSDSPIIEVNEDILIGDIAVNGEQLRPHVVWFGEAVLCMSESEQLVEDCDFLVVCGTSAKVYPAAGLIELAKYDNKEIIVVDPNPPDLNYHRAKYIREPAGNGIEKLCELIKSM